MVDKSVASLSARSLQIAFGWVRDPAEKANVLADTFASKFVLLRTGSNVFSIGWPCQMVRSFMLVRSSQVAKRFEQLDFDSGTGPDKVVCLGAPDVFPPIVFAVS